MHPSPQGLLSEPVLYFLDLLGEGRWELSFPVWAESERAERGNEKGTASGHKRLQRACASARLAVHSTSEPGPGSWARPHPAAKAIHLLGALRGQGTTQLPRNPGSCHPRREIWECALSPATATVRNR